MIPQYLQAYVVLLVIVASFVLIYKQTLRPPITLLLANLLFVLCGILTAEELLSGLANPSIISIVLLILLSAGIRKNFEIEMLFDRLYRRINSYRGFLLAMMTKVAIVSSLMNNTPVVAAMTPYVFNWGRKNHIAPSKLLIPLSYATICGGMITLIGTSTTMVLNGFLLGNGLPSLNVLHILAIGTSATVLVLLYIYIHGHKLLPSKSHLLDDFSKNRREYLVETNLVENSALIGKSIAEGGLRSLPGVYLVEIIRDQEIMSPIEPSERIEERDILIFAGNTQDIMDLVQSDKGLTLPASAHSQAYQSHRLVEVVVSGNSSMISQKIKESDFRNRYNAAIVAIHRNGERLSGKIGDQLIQAGDLLLLYAGNKFDNQMDLFRDLFVISELRTISKPPRHKILAMTLIALVALILLVTGSLSLLVSLLVVFTIMASFKMISIQDIKREVDFNLLAILVFSLAMGTAVVKSGAGTMIANLLVAYLANWGNPGLLLALLLVTTGLTSFISNIGAVSVTFPVALALSKSLPSGGEVFYLAIAFSASAAFLTPIGYQTNLMVYGPGGYNFKDFFKIGLPVTVIYLAAVFIMLRLLYPEL